MEQVFGELLPSARAFVDKLDQTDRRKDRFDEAWNELVNAARQLPPGARAKNALNWLEDEVKESKKRPAFRKLNSLLGKEIELTDCWTQPRLLAACALLLGQASHAAEHHHDFLSALEARHALATKGFPREFAKLVGQLVAFQNIWRNSVAPGAEVVLLFQHGDEWKREDAFSTIKLERALIALLNSLWGSGDKEKKLVALSAVSLGIESALTIQRGAHDDSQNKSSEWTRATLEEKRTEFEQRLASGNGGHCKPNDKVLIINLEFGHYRFNNDALRDKFVDETIIPIVNKLRIGSMTTPSLLEISLNRTWPNEVTGNGFDNAVYQDDCMIALLGDMGQRNISALVNVRVSKSADPGADRISDRRIEDSTEEAGHADQEDKQVWNDINEALARARKKREEIRMPEGDYLPLPLVHRALNRIAKIKPAALVPAFLTLHWAPARTWVVWLPRKAPKLTEGSRERDTDVIVARYLASIILNVRLAFGAGELTLRFQCFEADKVEMEWNAAIQWVERRCKHGTLIRYLDQVSSPNHRVLAACGPATAGELSGQTLAENSEGPLALGIDIGGTAVKIRAFSTKWNGGRLTVDSRHIDGSTAEVPTKAAAKPRYDSGQDFAKTILDRIEKDHRDPLWSEVQKRATMIVGVAWPGPVSGVPGEEYVCGTSGICINFVGLSNMITDNAPAALHALQIREGFQAALEEKFPGKLILVRLIHDGDAHSRSSRTQFLKHAGQRTVVLAAGTGTALGAPDEGPQSRAVLAEAGKFVINLLAPFPDATANMPSGMANDLFSQRTIPMLSRKIWNRSDVEVSALEFGVWAERKANEKKSKGVLDKWYANLKSDLTAAKNDWLLSITSEEAWKDREHFLINNGDETKMNALASQSGMLLADLTVLSAYLYDADTVCAGGGPMTGKAGQMIRDAARECLYEDYNYAIVEDRKTLGQYSDPSRRLIFPEPVEASTSGAEWGAARAAADFFELLVEREEQEKIALFAARLRMGDFVTLEAKQGDKDATTLKVAMSGEQEDVCLTKNQVVHFIDANRYRLRMYLVADEPSARPKYVVVGRLDPVLNG
jgi:hypothetical protein